MPAASKSNSTDMGAIEPIVARNRAKIKSASIETSSKQQSARSASNQYEENEFLPSMESHHHQIRDNNSFHQKAQKFLSLSPGTLKPSASTSCLFTATDDTTSGSNTCIPTRASLTHEWKKLKTPNKCRECNLLVYFNGRECSFCGFVAHKKCLTVLVIKCSGQQVTGLAKSRKEKATQSQFVSQSNPSSQQSSRKTKPLVQPIFGQPISIDSHQVVDFIRRFIYEIDTRGLTSKGIYRVSSIKSKVDRLCNYYDQNLSSLVDLSSFHPNIIANALKMYLRQLPEPLLTHQLYDNFIEVAKKYANSNSPSPSKSFNKQPQLLSSLLSKQRKPYLLSSSTTALNTDPSYNPMLIVELKEIIELLPPINRELIAIIMRHLKRVAEMSGENQMSAKNLSIIFGPTLLSTNNKSLAIVDNIHQARLVELMITWADQIFPQYANYESKAVIELDLPDIQFEQQLEMQDGRQKLTVGQTSDNSEKSASKSLGKQPKVKDGRKIQKHDKDIKIERNDLPQSKTRKDLRELRRQFFTVPTVQTDLDLTVVASKWTAPELNQGEQGRRWRSNNQAGSVPVIKVQPYYCDTLTKKYADKS